MKARTCEATGKRSFRHYQQAASERAHAERRLGQVELAQVPRQIYQCPHCGCWHMTSMTRKEYREGRVKG